MFVGWVLSSHQFLWSPTSSCSKKSLLTELGAVIGRSLTLDTNSTISVKPMGREHYKSMTG